MDYSTANVVYYLLLLTMIISFYLGMRRSPKQEIKNMFIWAGIVTLLLVGYALLH